MERKLLVIALAFITIAVAKKAVRYNNRFIPETAEGVIKSRKNVSNLLITNFC